MSAVTVEILLMDGSMAGMLTAAIKGWAGHILIAPISRFDAFSKRDEVKRSGVYVLIGEKAYIGESESIIQRIDHPKHELKRAGGEYSRIVAITSTDKNLTKAHIKYLEARLIELANKAKRIDLKNKTDQQNQLDNLPESDVAYMESFIKNLGVLLPAVGVDMFKTQTKLFLQEENRVENSPTFEIKGGSKYSARAKIIDSEFVLLEGSKLAKKWGGRKEKNYNKREELIGLGVLENRDTCFILTLDYEMSSPSLAASMVVGCESVSGPDRWKVEGSNKKYKEWIEERL